MSKIPRASLANRSRGRKNLELVATHGLGIGDPVDRLAGPFRLFVWEQLLALVGHVQSTTALGNRRGVDKPIAARKGVPVKPHPAPIGHLHAVAHIGAPPFRVGHLIPKLLPALHGGGLGHFKWEGKGQESGVLGGLWIRRFGATSLMGLYGHAGARVATDLDHLPGAPWLGRAAGCLVGCLCWPPAWLIPAVEPAAIPSPAAASLRASLSTASPTASPMKQDLPGDKDQHDKRGVRVMGHGDSFGHGKDPVPRRGVRGLRVKT